MQLRGSTDTAASFAFEKEDHTLGNALRYLISKNPDVEFVGYSIPHPSEAFMNLRIQTWGMHSNLLFANYGGLWTDMKQQTTSAYLKFCEKVSKISKICAM